MGQEPKIETKEILSSEKQFLEEAARLVSEYSWGKDYPIQPIDEIRVAEYRVGVFDSYQLVGFGTVGRSFSPDSLDNDELWVAHAVVAPEFRKRGLFRELYDRQLAYTKSQEGRILSCTDNPVVEKFFLENDWKEIRKTNDDSGESCVVFEYKRNDHRKYQKVP